MDRNEVVLTGRLPEAVQIRTLESGTRIGTWRLIVRRRPRGRGTRVDTIPCVSFDSGVIESVTGWLPDDVVEVVGSLRRRWWGREKPKASGYEVEIRAVRRLERRVTTVLTGDEGLPAADPSPAPVPARPRPLHSLTQAGRGHAPSHAGVSVAPPPDPDVVRVPAPRPAGAGNLLRTPPPEDAPAVEESPLAEGPQASGGPGAAVSGRLSA
ncbi:single-stranded DNA-binding protein [Planomonospora venezuelensis]|uniref:Single-stranded DNA-binding protein n=1 Tax=Planomonospora venezuelensis TaxID=1999 RepID=A0A841D203_PLAVE|nr:single-stranded DNA-binding protein [Planomonospora venezuelensis]MBB5963509.1 single-stranded DNA-binding protein [Planomonospora venezuelensis]GIN05569.1 hypothetical protein Pve01_72270 [Planomonospora venezuelensis]